MAPSISRPPSFALASHSDLGSFQKFLEKPNPAKQKKRRKDMPLLRKYDDWSQLGWHVLEIFVAETVGTGMLVFFGCMGLVSWTPGVPLPPFQGPIVFAVVVATIVQIFGHISAAHINPAVTIGFAVLGLVSPGMALVYILSECVGAILGYGLLILLTPAVYMSPADATVGLCCTMPNSHLSDVQVVALEFCATSFLVLVVCACTDPRNANKADSTPLKFGAVILALCISMGPYTGASMNPARSLAPALWTGTWSSQWVYWLGPCLGGFFSAIFYKAIFTTPRHKPPLTQEEAPLNQVKVNSQRSAAEEGQ